MVNDPNIRVECAVCSGRLQAVIVDSTLHVRRCATCASPVVRSGPRSDDALMASLDDADDLHDRAVRGIGRTLRDARMAHGQGQSWAAVQALAAAADIASELAKNMQRAVNRTLPHDDRKGTR